MCGLTGFFLPKPSSFEPGRILEQMTNLLSHRGPDHQAVWSGKWGTRKYPRGSIHLGHRRLKILDLGESSNQPFFSSDGALILIYNGELYNFKELRDELQALGHSFQTQGDTEVVLTAFLEWKTDCFTKFNGMWALAILDLEQQQLILSRDRFGEKPLYYYWDSENFIFGSEIKSLLAHPVIKPRPNLERIYRYLATNYRYGDIYPDSFFEGIFQVPSGSYLRFQPGQSPEVRNYWKLSTFQVDKDPQILTQQFLELFTDSVRLRLRSDVPVASLLSGGMDSTSVTAVARSLLGIPIRSFSGIMEETPGAFNESKFIESVSRFTSTPTSYVFPNPQDLNQTVEEMIYYFDEPVCTVTWYAAFLLSKSIAGQSVPVLLNGHAGDELLGGYWDHYHYHFWDLSESRQNALRSHEIRCWKQNHQRDPSEIQRHQSYWTALLKKEITEVERFPDYSFLFKENPPPSSWTPPAFKTCFQDSLSQRLFQELFYETTPAILKTEDRCTMAHSLESRTPFLDYRLVEFCFSLPSEVKIRDGYGKWILREAMRGLLPEDVRLRKEKVGFNAPSHQWFRGEGGAKLQKVLNSESIRERNLLAPDQVTRIFEEHLHGNANHQMVLWQLLNLELWFQRFLPHWKAK